MTSLHPHAADCLYFLCLCRSNHCLAASSIKSEAVRSTSSAARLMARMTSGSMVVRNCRLSPEGGFRPLLGDGLSSAIALPLSGAILGTVPWVATGGKTPDQDLGPFPRQSGPHPLADTAESTLQDGHLSEI